MASSGGRPTRMIAPVARLTPRSSLRRLIATSDPLLQKFGRLNEAQQQGLQVETRSLKYIIQKADGLLVRGRFQTPAGVAEDLAHDALLAHRTPRQNRPELD